MLLIHFVPSADKSRFKSWFEPLYDTNWHVYAKRSFAGPEQVLAYLARYTHRVAISNQRLIKADDSGVTFSYKDYRVEGPGRYKTMTVARQFRPPVLLVTPRHRRRSAPLRDHNVDQPQLQRSHRLSASQIPLRAR